MTGNDLILRRPSTPDSCGVRIALSSARSRPWHSLWFMTPGRPGCPQKVAQEGGSWSAPARSACTGLGWLALGYADGPTRVQVGRCRRSTVHLSVAERP